MFYVLLTFALVVGIVGGLYWLLIDREESQDAAQVLARLRRVAVPRKLQAALLADEKRLSDLGFFNLILRRSGALVRPLERLIAESGLNITVGIVLLACAAVGVLVLAAVYELLHLPLIAIPFGLLGAYIPIGVLRFVRTRRLLKFEEQFPEAMDLLSRALRAGHALTTALSMVSEEMPEPIGPEFQLLFDQQNFGLPLPQAMKNFGERLPSLDAKFFVTAVLTQRESGGNLSEVLENLASIIRDRFRVKRQVRVISAHGRITGWILSALPTTLGLFFAFTNPDRYRAFYQNPLGAKMIAGALLLQLVGILVIRKIVTIEY
jgi:tight adherence protein B